MDGGQNHGDPSASKAVKLKWLLRKLSNDDIYDLRFRAYEGQLECSIVFDKGRFQDCLENLAAHDLG